MKSKPENEANVSPNKTFNYQGQNSMKEKDSYDVTLSCDDKQIKTHKQILDLYEIKSDYNTFSDNQEKLKDRITYLEQDQLKLTDEKSILLAKLLEERSENENLKIIIADLQQCGSENLQNTDLEKESMAKQIEELENKLRGLEIAYSQLLSSHRKINIEENGIQEENKFKERELDILKYKETIMKLEEKNLNTNNVNLILKKELKEKEIKLNVLVDNIHTIVTPFQSI